MRQIDLFKHKTAAEQKFEDFHEKNPHVYKELVKLTQSAVDAGRTRIGINMLIEVVRWNRMLQTSDNDFKINNNYAPYYARLLMKENPQFDGIFSLRDLRA